MTHRDQVRGARILFAAWFIGVIIGAYLLGHWS